MPPLAAWYLIVMMVGDGRAAAVVPQPSAEQCHQAQQILSEQWATRAVCIKGISNDPR
jgi:hypothetical protein